MIESLADFLEKYFFITKKLKFLSRLVLYFSIILNLYKNILMLSGELVEVNEGCAVIMATGGGTCGYWGWAAVDAGDWVVLSLPKFFSVSLYALDRQGSQKEEHKFLCLFQEALDGPA